MVDRIRIIVEGPPNSGKSALCVMLAGILSNLFLSLLITGIPKQQIEKLQRMGLKPLAEIVKLDLEIVERTAEKPAPEVFPIDAICAYEPGKEKA